LQSPYAIGSDIQRLQQQPIKPSNIFTRLGERYDNCVLLDTKPNHKNGSAMYRSLGFTLIELLAALMISAILAMLAAPGFQHLLMRHQAHKIYSQTLQAINFARANALTTQTTTTLCPAYSNIECGKNWENGILVFNDINENGEIDNELERVLSNFPAGGHQYSLRWAAFGNRSYLRYTALGYTHSQNGTFVYCPENGDALYAHAIIINRAGRARRGYDKNRNGIIERANGKDIEC